MASFSMNVHKMLLPTDSCLTPRPLRVGEESSEADDELDSGDIIINQPIKRGVHDVSKRHSVDGVPVTKTTSATAGKSLSLPRSMTTALLHPTTSYEVKGQIPLTRIGKTKEEKKSKQPNRKKASKARPLELPLSRPRDHNKSHDRQVTKGGSFLPTVMSSSPQATPPHSPRPLHRSTNKLPILNNMQAVAMVAVDTDQDRLRVHNFGDNATPRKPNKIRPAQRLGRSRSMLPLK